MARKWLSVQQNSEIQVLPYSVQELSLKTSLCKAVSKTERKTR